MPAASPGRLAAQDPAPRSTILFQNFPNPFPAPGQDATCIWFDLATSSAVELEILDLRGNALRRFLPGPEFESVLPVGRYGRGSGGSGCDPRFAWDGRADDGRTVPSGVYLIKLRASGENYIRRIVFRGR